jgi:hypothetical protein
VLTRRAANSEVVVVACDCIRGLSRDAAGRAALRTAGAVQALLAVASTSVAQAPDADRGVDAAEAGDAVRPRWSRAFGAAVCAIGAVASPLPAAGVPSICTAGVAEQLASFLPAARLDAQALAAVCSVIAALAAAPGDHVRGFVRGGAAAQLSGVPADLAAGRYTHEAAEQCAVLAAVMRALASMCASGGSGATAADVEAEAARASAAVTAGVGVVSRSIDALEAGGGAGDADHKEAAAHAAEALLRFVEAASAATPTLAAALHGAPDAAGCLGLLQTVQQLCARIGPPVRTM